MPAFNGKIHRHGSGGASSLWDNFPDAYSDGDYIFFTVHAKNREEAREIASRHVTPDTTLVIYDKGKS